MKLFGTQKDKTGCRFYFLGMKVYEKVKSKEVKRTKVLGICIRKKRLTPPTVDYSTLLKRIEWRDRLHAAEQKILTLSLFYKDLPAEQRYILCFDHLGNHRTEAIDAWSFFQFLQKNGVPSKYAILRNNSLFKELQKENNLDDILPVTNELELLTNYPEIIAQSRAVMSSFGFDISRIFKQLPLTKYIFIEHGVVLLKEWCATGHYTEDLFDGKIVPTSLTKAFYERIGYGLKSCKKYYCGLPRWDRLKPADKERKDRKIFIFFTFRESFKQNPSTRKEYIKRIQSFVNKLGNIFDGTNVHLYLSTHHYMFLQDSGFNPSQIKGINIIPTTEISRMTMDADLCVTDFSSIGFDFIYRNVPVIYYCFDADVNYPSQNDRIALIADSIDRHLYNCCRDEKSAIETIQHYAKRDFELEDELKARNKSIFWEDGETCRKLLALISD